MQYVIKITNKDDWDTVKSKIDQYFDTPCANLIVPNGYWKFKDEMIKYANSKLVSKMFHR